VCDMTADDIGEEDSPSERQQELLLYSSADETESSFRKHRHRRSWTWTQRRRRVGVRGLHVYQPSGGSPTRHVFQSMSHDINAGDFDR